MGVHVLCHVVRYNNVLNGADKSWVTGYTREDNNFLEARNHLGEKTASAFALLINLLERQAHYPAQRSGSCACPTLPFEEIVNDHKAGWHQGLVKKTSSRASGTSTLLPHSPKLMSGMTAQPWSKLWLWRKPWCWNSGERFWLTCRKKMEQTRDTIGAWYLCL